MPPKAQYSKEKILAAAFSILKESGWAEVTARNISARLEASTQPIYSYLKSMDDLAEELRREAMRVMVDFQTRDYTDNPYINMAVGYIKFAESEKNLFNFIFFENPLPLEHNMRSQEAQWINETLEKKTGKKFDASAYVGNINEKTMDNLSLNSWIYIHGLAVLLSSGTLKPMNDKKIIEMVSNAGMAFYIQSQQK